MRLLSAWLLLTVSMAGCFGSEPTGSDPGAELDVYVFYYPAQGIMTTADSAYPLAWAMTVRNPTNVSVSYEVSIAGMVAGRGGIVTDTRWLDTEIGPGRLADALGPRESRLWIYEGDSFLGHTFTLHVLSGGQSVFNQTLGAADGGGIAIGPGMHVQTRTVGLWVNGTSFYTNIPEMLADEAFPAGGNINRTAAIADATPLPIYVYDADRSEQPDSSIDQCYFTTIPGYNALLKQQVTGVTGAGFLSPEEAYTRAGNEEHLLYGDALVFLNVVTAVDTPPGGDQPDPQGACFDVNRYTPGPIPDVPPTFPPLV